MAVGVEPRIMSAASPENLAKLHRGEEEMSAHSIAFLQPSRSFARTCR